VDVERWQDPSAVVFVLRRVIRTERSEVVEMRGRVDAALRGASTPSDP
jgi:hypothetical protein